MDTKPVLYMNGGMGEISYANNCTVQRKVMLRVKPILEENIKRLLSYTDCERILKVADLGCSSGPNTLMVISDIILTINDNRKLSKNREAPTLQIYLNDLFENDFNNISKLLSEFYTRIQKRGVKNNEACFVNFTPGTFYGRLFPSNYIHFFHSSYSLHWLSQAPEELNKGGTPLNKGSSHLTSTSPPIVYKAYFEQFQRDFKLFLKARSDELKPGGCMVLTFIVREKVDEFLSVMVVIGIVLKDMVLEGLVEEAKLDTFNLPVYNPTIEEVRQVIEAEGSFTLQMLEAFKICWDGNREEEVDDSVLDSKVRGELTAKSMRSIFEPLLTAEFGKYIMDELFSRFAKKVSQLYDELGTLEYPNLVISVRKISR